MFNPQRRSKPSDIFMQERAFKMHLDKVRSLRGSSSPKNEWASSQMVQQKYLKRLHNSKEEVKSRLSNHIFHENQRLFHKLITTDRRSQQYSLAQSTQKHFNSYFNNKKLTARIKGDNFGMVTRVMNQSSTIPTLEEMKRDYRQSKRYEKMGRKLPAILRLQETAKKQFSPDNKSSRYSSKASLRSSGTPRGRGSSSYLDKTVTQHIKHIQETLVQKQ